LAGKRVAKKPKKEKDGTSRQKLDEPSRPQENTEKAAYERYYDFEPQEGTLPNAEEVDYPEMPDEDTDHGESLGRDRAAEIRAAIEAAIAAQETKRAAGETLAEPSPNFDLYDAGESKDTGETADEGPEILTERFPRRSRPLELRPRKVPDESIKRSLPAVQTGKALVETKKASNKSAMIPVEHK
jgi:hypothetical protein